jgi:hypothetical protein
VEVVDDLGKDEEEEEDIHGLKTEKKSKKKICTRGRGSRENNEI